MALVSAGDRRRIEGAVADGERRTSGEIVVHLERRCPIDPLERAARLFSILRLQRTERRNAVLIYAAVADHKLAVLGDVGANAVVAPAFWDRARDSALELCRAGDVAGGLCAAVRMVAESLAPHFPREADDRDELPNVLSEGAE